MAARLGEAGWLRRLGTQFHWENAGYSQLRGFFGRAVVAQAQGAAAGAAGCAARRASFRVLRGAEITAREWEAFYGFYSATVDRKWGPAPT